MSIRILGLGPGLFLLVFFGLVTFLTCFIILKTRHTNALILLILSIYMGFVAILLMLPRTSNTLDQLIIDKTWYLRLFLLIIAGIGIILAFIIFLLEYLVTCISNDQHFYPIIKCQEYNQSLYNFQDPLIDTLWHPIYSPID